MTQTEGTGGERSHRGEERPSRLADIAEHAGVSEATVSRVLNDRPGVAPGTREVVLTTVDVLGYDRPSRLRAAAVPLVGLITPELVNPIFPAFAQQIEASLSARGYTPVLCTQAEGGMREDAFVEMLLGRGVAGIVYVSGQHSDLHEPVERYLRLRERGLPLVFVNGHREGIDAPFVSDDDVAAMDQAVRHLADLGHTRIGLALGPERFVPVRRKEIGFTAAMSRHLGHDHLDGLVVHTLFGIEGGASAARRLLEQEVTAIVCGSDLMGLGVIREARARGLSVPQDLSVVGYDDSDLMAFTDPPLTTLRQSVQSMGQAAVEALVEEIEGVSRPRGEFVFRPELVVRGSTAAVPEGSRRRART